MATNPLTVFIGMRWGWLECTGIEIRRELVWDEGTSEEIDREYLLFKCDCGKQLEITRREWKGKRSARDCGCNGSLNLEPKITITFQVSVPVATEMKRRALGNGLSQWLRDLVSKELKNA